MGKIVLTLATEYCSHWTFWNGAREILQNARDAEEYEGLAMTVKHLPQSNKLTISTKDTVVPPALLLLLGASSKRDSDQRGKFGEGAVLGILALVRAGHAVTIFNGDEVWRPEITTPDEGHTFEGSQLLVFNTRKLPSPRTDFTVEIENVSKEVWAATKKLFLFLQPAKVAETVVTDRGTVLLNEEYKGMIFSRGIFVTRNDTLHSGYDLANLKLDRDRNVVEEWDLQYRLGQLWNDACAAEPDKFADKVYKMAKEDRAEVKSLHYHADEKLLKRLRESFEEEHGAGAIPVSDMTESRELEQLGAKTAVVNKTLRELLEKGGPRPEEQKKKLQGQVRKTLAWGDLTEGEYLGTYVVGRVTTAYLIVEFNDPTIPCRWLEDLDQVGVARHALTWNPRDLLYVVAQQEARRRGIGVPTDTVLLDVIFPPKPQPVSATEEPQEEVAF